MKTIVKIKYGSNLYGTATKESDLDIKGIYIPNARDILLQRIKPVIVCSEKKQLGEKNTSKNIDFELYSPERYLLSLAKGQSFALEMLFAPESYELSETHPKWLEIKQLASKILTKKSTSFVSYCRQQAYKYCTKGSRLAAAKIALKALKEAEFLHGKTAKLFCIKNILNDLAQKSEYLFLNDLHFKICGKTTLLNASIETAGSTAQKIISQYGTRSIESEKNKGADWKALSHAVRIGYQSIEFLKNHTMTFPRPEAKHLLAIKQGKIPFKEVTKEIDQLLIDVEKAAQHSSLPENYDPKIIDDFIVKLYLKEVTSYKLKVLE